MNAAAVSRYASSTDGPRARNKPDRESKAPCTSNSIDSHTTAWNTKYATISQSKTSVRIDLRLTLWKWSIAATCLSGANDEHIDQRPADASQTALPEPHITALMCGWPWSMSGVC